MRIEVKACKALGKRLTQQDSLLIDRFEVQEDEIAKFDLELIGNEPRFLAIADGMGGEAHGGEAAAMATAMVRQYIEEKADEYKFQELKNLLRLMNDKLSQMFKKTGQVGGTTLSLLVLENTGLARIINIGDSPIMYLTKGEIYQVTEDQSLAGLKYQAGLIPLEEYKKTPERGILAAYLGDTSGNSIQKVFTSSVQMTAGDVIVLSSDGLVDNVEPAVIRDTILTSWDTCTSELMKRAACCEDQDNLAMALVKIQEVDR